MASFLDRIRKRARRVRAGRSAEPAPADADPEAIEAALVEAEELAARTSELARDLHKLLASGIARRRATRGTRILH
ncbi:MAG: hypothetical protein DCC71_16975 [Proteobacteria bacterium]|nr:MAG: hypothetical protein DCC71_16975 [Pseudomonadota bacterium]